MFLHTVDSFGRKEREVLKHCGKRLFVKELFRTSGGKIDKRGLQWKYAGAQQRPPLLHPGPCFSGDRCAALKGTGRPCGGMRAGSEKSCNVVAVECDGVTTNFCEKGV